MPRSKKIFQSLRDKIAAKGDKLPDEQRATYWLQQQANLLHKWQIQNEGMSFDTLSNRDFTKQLVAAAKPVPGFFYFFMYRAKYDKTLPYWDAFPFDLCLHTYDDGMLCLNFHYLSYADRARLFDALYPLREGRAGRSTTRDIRMRLKVTYAILKLANSNKYAHWKPCIKRYLTDQIRSPLLKVGAKEWDLALMLPVQRFQKAAASTVWRKSVATTTPAHRRRLFP